MKLMINIVLTTFICDTSCWIVSPSVGLFFCFHKTNVYVYVATRQVWKLDLPSLSVSRFGPDIGLTTKSSFLLLGTNKVRFLFLEPIY